MNIILTGLLVVLVAFLVSSMAIRLSLKPLNRLVASAEAMGGGDFSAKADVQGSPELQELSELQRHGQTDREAIHGSA